MIKAVRLEGSSMLPLFRPGEIVLIDDNCRKSQGISHKFATAGALVASAPCPGDCVVYFFEGRSLLHRVIAVGEEGPLISDDTGLIGPHKVPWGDIIGRVITHNPLKKGRTGLIYSKLKKGVRFIFNGKR